MDLLGGQTHRVVIRPVRRPLRAFRYVPARQPGLDIGLGVHRTLGPPGPTHANSTRNAKQLPRDHRVFDPGHALRLGLLFRFVEFYGQIAAL